MLINDKFYTSKEACEYLKISNSMLYSLIKENKLDFIGKPIDFIEQQKKLEAIKEEQRKTNDNNRANSGRPHGKGRLYFTKEMLDKYIDKYIFNQ